jgi:hypothetical protein
MTNIMNLPLDVWCLFVEHLSLNSLASMYDAFSSSSTISSIIERRAIKVIATLLTTGIVTILPNFSNNGPCSKFGAKHPRAGQYWHQKDHGGKLPCGGKQYVPHFPLVMKNPRNFHRNGIGNIKTEMIVVTKTVNATGHIREMIHPRPNDGGPTEILQVIVSLSPVDSALIDGQLQLKYNTLSENIEDAFTDMSFSRFRMERVIEHHLPLQSVGWTDRTRKFHPLPFEWFVFSGSSISASSTFSKTLEDPSSEEYWTWEISSFETRWILELSRSIHCQISTQYKDDS